MKPVNKELNQLWQGDCLSLLKQRREDLIKWLLGKCEILESFGKSYLYIQDSRTD